MTEHQWGALQARIAIAVLIFSATVVAAAPDQELDPELWIKPSFWLGAEYQCHEGWMLDRCTGMCYPPRDRVLPSNMDTPYSILGQLPSP